MNYSIIICATKSYGYFPGETSKENGLFMENDTRNAKPSESGNSQNSVIRGKDENVPFHLYEY